jgi:hypothetical protein
MVTLDLHRPSHVMCGAGAAAVMVSGFVPWITGTTAGTSFSLVPATTPYVRGAVVVALFGVVAGAAVFARRGSPAVLGLAGAVWLNASLGVWLVGWRLYRLVPLNVIPDQAGVALEWGAALGIVGALLVVTGAVLVLTEDTWPAPVERPDAWRIASALALVAVAAALRTVPWFTVDGGSLRWRADMAMVPVVGDILSLTLLAVTVLLVVSVVHFGRWTAVVLAVAGVVVGGLALLTLLAQAMLDEAANVLVDRVGVSIAASAGVSWGPWLALAFAATLVAYALMGLRRPAAPMTELAMEPMADPALPF